MGMPVRKRRRRSSAREDRLRMREDADNKRPVTPG